MRVIHNFINSYKSSLGCDPNEVEIKRQFELINITSVIDWHFPPTEDQANLSYWELTNENHNH